MGNNKEMYLRWLKQGEASGDVEMILYCTKKLEACETESDGTDEVKITNMKCDIVNITLHFFLKDVRSMLHPVMRHSIVAS